MIERDCIFRYPKVRETIDPVIAEEWKRTYGTKAPFGDLRRQWKIQHCRTLNPYGSETCPYSLEACTAAFAEAVAIVTRQRLRSPGGYFGRVARSHGAIRADNKPLARERSDAALGSGFSQDVRQDPGEGPWLHSTSRGFDSIGDLLRALDPRTRQKPEPDGEESGE